MPLFEIMSVEERYEELLQAVEGLAEGEGDAIALMANVTALIHREMGFWWTGFYVVKPSADCVPADTFEGIDPTIPVTVPMANVPAYREASGWRWFVNIVGKY